MQKVEFGLQAQFKYSEWISDEALAIINISVCKVSTSAGAFVVSLRDLSLASGSKRKSCTK